MDTIDIEEMEKELIERKIISPKLPDNELREKIITLLATEGKDSKLGKQIWQYCLAVDFDVDAIQPIIDRDPLFLSELDNMGSVHFNILLRQLQLLKEISDANAIILKNYALSSATLRNYEELQKFTGGK